MERIDTENFTFGFQSKYITVFLQRVQELIFKGHGLRQAPYVVSMIVLGSANIICRVIVRYQMARLLKTYILKKIVVAKIHYFVCDLIFCHAIWCVCFYMLIVFVYAI